jgi:NCS1 family nucleobase:cation symporter-1
VLTLFVGASTYVLVVDYWIIRRRKWKIPDLFMGKGSIYWYSGGWNFRCVVALLLGMWPSMPGLVWDIQGRNLTSAWVRIFQINYFVRVPISVCTYLVLCWAFPPKGCGVQENLSEQEDGIVIEGVEIVGDKCASNGKDELTGEKSV